MYVTVTVTVTILDEILDEHGVFRRGKGEGKGGQLRKRRI